MAGKNDSLLGALAALPWWINVALAIILYSFCKFVAPVIPSDNPFLGGILLMLPAIAPFLALTILLVTGISALNGWRKGKRGYEPEK